MYQNHHNPIELNCCALKPKHPWIIVPYVSSYGSNHLLLMQTLNLILSTGNLMCLFVYLLGIWQKNISSPKNWFWFKSGITPSQTELYLVTLGLIGTENKWMYGQQFNSITLAFILHGLTDALFTCKVVHGEAKWPWQNICILEAPTLGHCFFSI